MTTFWSKTIAISLALISLTLGTTDAQTSTKQLSSDDAQAFQKALKLANKANNRDAIGILRDLYVKYPENLSIAYNLGICYINASGNPDSTLFFLERVRELDDNDSWDDTRRELYLAIARANQLCGKPKEALKVYEEVEASDTKGTYAEIIQQGKDVCATAIVLMNQPVRLVMRHCGTQINSDYNDYRPVLTADEDTMYFTSRRPKKDADGTIVFDDGQFEEGVYFSVREGNKWDGGNWGKATQVQGLITNAKGYAGQETVTSMSADGEEMYLAHDGDIYVSHRDPETRQWLPATPLPEPVNTVFNEDFAFVTPDGQDLFISSDCPGGYGKKDIYVSHRLPNGQWGMPLNLGQGVNTEEDEDAPFYHAQSGILYYCSRGHEGMGGYDIFYSPSNEKGEFQVSTNMGYPINSADDDLYFAPSNDRDRAYFSSIRWNDKGQAPSYDLYEIEYEQPEQNRMVVITAKVHAKNLENVRVLTLQDGDIIGIGRPNTHSCNFVTIVEAGGEYDLVAYCDGDSIPRHVKTLKSQSYYAAQQPVCIDPFVFGAEELADASAQPGQEGEVCGGNDAQAAADEHSSVVARESARRSGDKPYTVQIMSLRAPLDFKLLHKNISEADVFEYVYRNGWYVYSVGSYATYSEARKAQEEIRNSTNYDDAFARNSNQYKKYVVEKSDDANSLGRPEKQ